MPLPHNTFTNKHSTTFILQVEPRLKIGLTCSQPRIRPDFNLWLLIECAHAPYYNAVSLCEALSASCFDVHFGTLPLRSQPLQLLRGLPLRALLNFLTHLLLLCYVLTTELAAAQTAASLDRCACCFSRFRPRCCAC